MRNRTAKAKSKYYSIFNLVKFIERLQHYQNPVYTNTNKLTYTYYRHTETGLKLETLQWLHCKLDFFFLSFPKWLLIVKSSEWKREIRETVWKWNRMEEKELSCMDSLKCSDIQRLQPHFQYTVFLELVFFLHPYFFQIAFSFIPPISSHPCYFWYYVCILQTCVSYRIYVEVSNTVFFYLFHFVCLFISFSFDFIFLLLPFISILQILMPDKEKTKLVVTPTEKRKADDIEIKDLKKVSAYKKERQHIICVYI